MTQEETRELTDFEVLTHTPFSMFVPPESPQFRREGALRQAYDPAPKPLSWWGKLGSAIRYETVAGEAAADWWGPRFTPNPSFILTDDLMTKYAGDIPEEIRERIKTAEPESFLEFLHEVGDVKIALKNRKALFEGGAIGMVEGFAAILLASGGEAAALSAAAIAAGAATGGPVGAFLAGKTTAAARFKRIKAAATMMGVSLVIDVPLETARQELDKSLTRTDLLIALGATGVLSGGLGAAFPGLAGIRGALNTSITDSVKEEAAEFALKTGNKEAAEALTPPMPTARIISDVEVLESVTTLKGKALKAEADRLKIPGRGRMKANELRAEIASARRAELPGEEEAANMAKAAIEKGETAKSLQKIARSFGVHPRANATKAEISKLIIKEVRKMARTGTRAVPKIPKFSSAVRRGLRSQAQTKTVGGTKYKLIFASDLEKALWRLGGSIKDAQLKKELIEVLEKEGIKDPETLGQLLREASDEQIKSGEGIVKGTLEVDASKMMGKPLGKQIEEPVEIRFDPDTDGVVIVPKSKATERADNRVYEEDGPHEFADAPENIVVIDGREASRGPALPGIGLLETEDYAEIARIALQEARRHVGSPGIGTRERMARLLEGSNKLPLGPLGRWINNAFTPSHVVISGMKAKDPIFYVFNDILFPGPRRSGRNAYSIVQGNVDRIMGEMQSGTSGARRMWVEQGGVDADFNNTVVRALTAGEDPADEALAQAVNSIRLATEKILRHLQKNGLIREDIPDSRTWFKRVYSTPSFASVAARFSTEDEAKEALTDFFFKSIKSKAAKDDKNILPGVARESAKRIVSFGLDPQAHRSHNATVSHISTIREQIKAELLDSYGIKGNQKEISRIDEHVEEVIEAIVESGSTDPHLKGFQKSRINLDENYEEAIGGVRTHIDEFFNRDIDNVLQKYAHVAFGSVEIRKVMRLLGKEYENMPLAEVATKMSKLVEGPSETFAHEYFTLGLRRISGTDLWESSEETIRNVVAVQSFAQGLVGQVLGLAQLPELANVSLRPGVRNSMAAFPSLRTLGRTFSMGITKEKNLRGLDGRLLDKVASEFETHFGCGNDVMRKNHIYRRLDDMGLDTELKGAWKFLDMGRMVSLLHPLGLLPMDTFMRRWGTAGYFQKFVNEAYRLKNGQPILQKSFWTDGKQRFMELGLSEDEAVRVFKALGTPDVVEVRKGLLGNYKVLDVDLNRLSAHDQHAYDLLVMAIRRGVDRDVQRQGVSEMPLWMNRGPWVKAFTQYRVFMMASRAKQLAAGMARGDAREALNMAGSVFFGGVGYTLLTYGRALSRPAEERGKYMAEYLTFENMWKSGIMRSSYASFFPAIIDSALTYTGQQAYFGPNMRSTGLGVDLITGTVPFGLAKAVGGVLKETGSNIFTDDEVTNKDIRDALRLAWFTRIPFVQQGIDTLVNQSPLRQKD